MSDPAPDREKIPPVKQPPTTVVRLPTSPLTPGERELARWLIRKALEEWQRAA